MRYLLTLFALPIFAQPTNIQVARTTHQQAAVFYNAPAGDDCLIEVSEDPSFATVVPDVDSGKFSGANSDLSRPSKWISGTRRAAVIGARVVDKASDGRRYSRSLEQNKFYYGRLSSCGGSATFTIATRVQPWGMQIDTLPSHPDAGMEGYYGFPSEDPNNRDEVIIDPFTGQRLFKIQLPGDNVDQDYKTGASAKLGTPTSSTWATPENATTVADSNAVATYSGTTQGVLFVPNAQFAASNTSTIFLAQLVVDVTAQITGGATGEDAKLQICLGTATVCHSPWRDFTVSTSGSLATVTLGDDEPQDYFWTNGEFPNDLFWYSSGGVGYRIRVKTTNPAYTAQIDSVVQKFRQGINYNSSSSQYHQIHPLTITEPADGRSYRLAYFFDRTGGQNGAIYSLATDGTAHYMGSMAITNGVNGSTSTMTIRHLVFDRTNPRRFYALSTGFVLVRGDISSASGTLSTDLPTTYERKTQSPKITWTPITATGYTIDDQVAAFNPAFNAEWKSKQKWLIHTGQNGYIVLKDQMGQDAGTWLAIFDPAAPAPAGCATCQGGIIAAAPFGATAAPQANKFCTLHAISLSQQPGWVHLGTNRQETVATATNNDYWEGPWRIQVKKPGCDMATQDCAMSTTDTVFEIVPQSGDYNFVDPNPGGTDDGSIAVEVGDTVIYKPAAAIGVQKFHQWLNGDEYMEVIAKDDVAHTITVRRGTNVLNSEWMVGTGFESGPMASRNITNTARSLPEGSWLYGQCRFTPMNDDVLASIAWNFLADPYGDRTVKPAHKGSGTVPPAAGLYSSSSGYVSPKVMQFTNFGSHGVWGRATTDEAMYADVNDGWCVKYFNAGDLCYGMQVGPNTVDTLNGPVNRSVAQMGRFAGADPNYASASSYQSHLRQSQQFGSASGRQMETMYDVKPFVAPTSAVTLTAISGNTYRYTGSTLRRKFYPTMASSADRILTDISGPGSVIDDTKPWSYCVVLIAGECVGGSTVGQVYANIPLKNLSGCYAVTSSNFNAYPSNQYGACIENRPPYTLGTIQIDTSRDDYSAIRTRMLASGPTRPGVQTQFAVPFTSGDGMWTTYLGERAAWSGHYMVKAGVIPSPYDTLGNTFDIIPLDLYHATATKFRLEFGYREAATETAFQCTTRAEKCIIDSATVDLTNPFKWASESLSYISCSSGRCKAELPRIPGRIIFSRALFYDASNALIETRALPPQ